VTHFLDGAFQRVKRTEKHLAELDVDIRAFEEAQGQFRADNLNEEQIKAEHAKGGEVPLPMPSQVSILIGEIAYNLRSALDYLVYALAVLDSGVEQDRTQFPIEDTPERFERRKKQGFLRGLNAAHIADIERLQPYKGCDWTRLLRGLSNPDKHRHLTLTIRPKQMVLIIGRTVTQTGPDTFETNVDVKDRWAETRVLFPGGSPIVETLQTLKSQVADTLDAFKPDF
jgi:hypothetical protein